MKCLHALLGSILKMATCCIGQAVGYGGTGRIHHLQTFTSNNYTRDFIIKLEEKLCSAERNCKACSSLMYCI